MTDTVPCIHKKKKSISKNKSHLLKIENNNSTQKNL